MRSLLVLAFSAVPLSGSFDQVVNNSSLPIQPTKNTITATVATTPTASSTISHNSAVSLNHAASTASKVKQQESKLKDSEHSVPSIKTVAKTHIKKAPLNLSIPDMDTVFTVNYPSQQLNNENWLKKPSSDNDISYDAELVFDTKEGTTITGGKVIINIPFG